MIQQRFQKLLDDAVLSGQAAGCAALLYQNGKELAYAASGVRSLGASAPFDRKTVLRMYSMTKVVTAAAVMTLWDRGRLSPDDCVSRFFPSYASVQVCGSDGVLRKAQRPMTIRHLLTMTSGIPYRWESDAAGALAQQAMQALASLPETQRTTSAFTETLAKCPLMFEPGSAYLYGLSADVLGGIVEKATDMPFDEYLSETFFTPLGMADTSFALLPHMEPRAAQKYRWEASSLVPDDSYTGIPGLDSSPNILMGGSGLYSTIDDFMKFGEMLRIGGMGIIRKETIAEMTQNQLPECIADSHIRKNNGYGYGYLVRTLSDPALSTNGEGSGAFGWGGMAGTDLRIDPMRGCTLVYGVQRVPGFQPPLLEAMKDASV